MRLLMLALACLPVLALAAPHPRLPVKLQASQAAGLRAAVAPLLAMSEADMLKLVPEQSGLYFVSCANCTQGQQEGQLTSWDIKNPYAVKCAFCGHEYPSAQYPMDKVLEVKTPSGTTARHPYYEGRPVWWKGQEPYRFYFQARADFHRLRYMEKATGQMARLFWLTKEPEIGRRAALLLARFATVYPNYNHHFDYPFNQKVIYDGDVARKDRRAGHRTARWHWWGFMDLSTELLTAYDLLAAGDELPKLPAAGGDDAAADVRTMLTTMAEQVLYDTDEMGNMSPGLWADIILGGRVLERPEWIHECLGRFRLMARQQFFYDGSWMEGAPAYHAQVMGAFSAVFNAANGYSDPPGWKHPQTEARFDNLDLAKDLPEVGRAQEALRRMHLPDGRQIPVHDTWWSSGRIAALPASEPDLLPGMGHAILGAGEGASQSQASLTWSPGYGHTHFDGLGLLLFAQGKELLSDIGYTHTKWREWTILSPAHNLVVVDGANQKADPMTLGHLRTFTAGPDVQAVAVDNPQVYPGVTDVYRRTVALVKPSPTDSYLVDFFEVQGGGQHDYFLHGSADEAQTLTAAGLATQPLPTLLPEGVKFVPAESEGQYDWSAWHGYGYLRDLQSGSPAAGVTVLDYTAAQPGSGLQAFVVTQAGDQVVLGRGPSIRQAGSDDSKLESTSRQFAMLRRTGGKSLFAAVLAPYGDTKVVKRVRVVDVPGAKMALEVQTAQRTDLIVYGAELQAGTWQGQALSAQGELAVLGVQDGKPQIATVIGGGVTWGQFGLKTEPATSSAPLTGVGRGVEPSLLVAGNFPATPGAVVTLDHAGQYTSAYTVKRATFDGTDTALVVAEALGFDWESDNHRSRFFTVPNKSFMGPHVVRLIAAAHLHKQ